MDDIRTTRAQPLEWATIDELVAELTARADNIVVFIDYQDHGRPWTWGFHAGSRERILTALAREVIPAVCRAEAEG